MAQGTQEPRGEHAATVSLPADWFAVGAKAAGYRVTDEGVMVDREGYIVTLDPAAINYDSAEFRACLAQALIERLRNRGLNNVNGVSPQAHMTAMLGGKDLPSNRSNDAFDNIYLGHIADLVDGLKGWTAETVNKMTKEQKAERQDFIATNAAHDAHKTKHYDASVKAAFEAGKTAGEKRESKRTKKAPSAEKVLTL